MPLAVLVRDDTGDSATGEKYESPPRAPGDDAPGGGICVCTFKGAGGCGSGNRGGGALTMPARLSPVAARCRRLVLDAFRGSMVPPVDCVGIGNWAGADAGGHISSSSSSSCWLRYGFSSLPPCSRVQAKSGAAESGLVDAFGALSFRCNSRALAHFFICSSFVYLIIKFSTPGSPFHQI